MNYYGRTPPWPLKNTLAYFGGVAVVLTVLALYSGVGCAILVGGIWFAAKLFSLDVTHRAVAWAIVCVALVVWIVMR